MMASLCVLGVLTILFPIIAALQITSPSALVRSIHSPIQNFKTSPNRTEGYTAQLALWTKGLSCPGQSVEIPYDGRAVVVDAKDYNLEEVIRLCHCVESAGGIALVMTFDYPGEQSFIQRMHPSEVSRCNLLPLATRDEDWGSALDELANGTVIEALIQIDPNPWADLWDSAEFIILLRVLVPLVSIVSMVVGVRAAWAHWQTRRLVRGTKHDKILRWIIAALLLEAVACTIRAIYLIGGPLYCNSTFTVTAHAYLLTLTLPIEIMTTLMAVIVFQHWTAFGNKAFPIWAQVVFVCLGMAVFGLELAAGYARDQLKDGVEITVAQGVIYFPILLGTSVLFLHRGYKFYSTLANSSESVDKPRAMRKAVLWLMVGGGAELVLIVGVLTIGFGGDAVFDPYGTFSTYLIIITAGTTLSLSHVFAFVPQRRKNSLAPVEAKQMQQLHSNPPS